MIRFGMDWSFFRGMQSEDNVEKALQKLAKQKKIQSYSRSPRNSKLDRKGVDFTVTRNNGKDEYIQVKSSDTAAAQWNKKRGRPGAVNGQSPNVVKSIKKLLFGRVLETFHGMSNPLINEPRGWIA